MKCVPEINFQNNIFFFFFFNRDGVAAITVMGAVGEKQMG